MKLCVHHVLHPDPSVAGVLVHDEQGFDYAPSLGSERGRLFAERLGMQLARGTTPADALAYWFDKGGPHAFESLGLGDPTQGPTRTAALYHFAESNGVVLNWSAAVSSDRDAQPTAPEQPHLPDLPRALKQAMALQTIAALHRRHHGSVGLRLLEMHPGGGTYDCLALIRVKPIRTMAIFNLAGSSLALHEVDRPRPPKDVGPAWHDDLWRYPREFVSRRGGRRLADALEERLGLPSIPTAPATSPSSLAVAVLAELAHRYALSDRAPAFRSGWLDSSGMGGSSVREWVSDFPTIQSRCDAANGDWEGQALAANRLWGVYTVDNQEGRAPVVLDLGTGLVYGPGAHSVGSLWKRFQKGAGIRELAWWVEGLWRG